MEPVPGKILEPCSMPPVDCSEELDTPDPLSFGEDVLYFMEMSVEDARAGYVELLSTHVSPEMREACPSVD